MISNPNGANGTTSDPREQTCWDNYVESIAQNRENAYQAALDAGYEESSAKKITVTRWFTERKEKLKRKEMLSDAEKLLAKTIRYDHVDKDGNIKTDLLRIQTDVSKTLVQTLGKNEGYSTRSELTGADGKDLPIPILHGISDNNSDKENSVS